ncbi:hypothetical protein CEXT_153801 [Caerostris extrusa]|uniref:Secreted protein n=1 Tax=Caerostris extrusa TaxID=172846 RepID=A0AAV4PSS6_CAEEX|nr:hypothetical protein CEXT_153801 [Caerostris extrusa]
MLCPSWAATISRFLQINMGVILLMHHLPSSLKKRSLRSASPNDPDGVFVACHSSTAFICQIFPGDVVTQERSLSLVSKLLVGHP